MIFYLLADHELSKDKLLELIWNSDQYEHLYMLGPNSTDAWTLDFYHNPPSEEWVRVNESGYSREEILTQQTFMGILNDYAKKYPTDSGERWRQMNPLWGRGSTQLVANVHIKRLYLEALYEQCLGEGVQFIETRKNFGPAEWLYEIDTSGTSSATNGKKYLDNQEGALELNITQEVLEKFRESNPSFIDHRRIIYSSRYKNPYVAEDMNRAINLREQFPKHVIGYDLVAEEDNGDSHLYYLKEFMQLSDNGESKIPLYLHTAETNWPEDLITAGDDNDPVATLENIYDAVLLGSKRVGHGLGFFKHPYILQLLKTRGMAIEVCPVSNQLLGFFPDLRVHPALLYYRSGVPIVLGADDPGTFGYNYFSIDWYEIFMAWGLTLADLKQLALNSFTYSSMDADDRTEALALWSPEWNKYIADLKQEACSTTFSSTPYFSRIMPTVGASTGPTDVHVYGRNFEKAICKNITCKFGELQSTEVTYLSNYHITCKAPEVSTVLEVLQADMYAGLPAGMKYQRDGEIVVQVTVDLGDNVAHTVGNFTYMYDPYTTTLSPSTTDHGTSTCASLTLLFLTLLASTLY